MEQRGRELDNRDPLVEKAINKLQPPSILREIDQRYHWGNCPAYTTVAKSQTLATWDPRSNPSKKKPCQLGILETSPLPPPKRLRTSPYTPRTHIPRVPRMSRPPTRKLGRRKRDNVAWNTSGLKTTLVLPQKPMSMPSKLSARLARTWVISPIPIVVRRVTTRQSVPSQRRTKTPQKTSDSLNDLHFDDWSSLLPWNAFLVFNTRFESGKIEKKPCWSWWPRRSRRLGRSQR